jgi:acyl phosphate:glycerol-3-phosphate acyltransferase
MTIDQIFTLFVAYLLGSIPSGLLISWAFKLKDPRSAGSGSTGATNILRSGHYIAAGLTLFLDILKGSAAVLFALIYEPSLINTCAIFAVIGHIFPVWLGFKGGKGVATALGTLFILSWPLAFICIVCWGTLAILFRYSSLASILTVILSPAFTAYLSGSDLVITCAIMAALIVGMHRKNIGRLITGREPKIGKSNSENE